MKLSAGEKAIALKACRKPTMREHRGRTWDATTVLLDGVEASVYYDKSWGTRFYIFAGGRWYSWGVYEFDPGYRQPLTTYPPKEVAP